MANPPSIDLIAVTPPLPEGWEGTPDDLLAWYNENTSYFFDGTFPTGQIGGSMPTQDIGIWYNPPTTPQTGGGSIEAFVNGAYQPITDVPISSILDYAGNVTVPPSNYLFCDGSNYQQSQYPLLFAVIGGTYTPSSGIGVGTFNVPNLAGRGCIGAGTGNYNIITAASPTGTVGTMTPLTLGQYLGAEGVTARVNNPVGSPTGNFFTNAVSGMQYDPSKYIPIRNPSLVVQKIIRYR